MAATSEPPVAIRRRGRPSTKKVTGALVRRNLLIDPQLLDELRGFYGTSSDSETVRQAVEAAVLVFEAEQLRGRLAAHNGPDDVYARTTGVSRLPVHLRPEDVAESEKLDYPG